MKPIPENTSIRARTATHEPIAAIMVAFPSVNVTAIESICVTIEKKSKDHPISLGFILFTSVVLERSTEPQNNQLVIAGARRTTALLYSTSETPVSPRNGRIVHNISFLAEIAFRCHVIAYFGR